MRRPLAILGLATTLVTLCDAPGKKEGEYETAETLEGVRTTPKLVHYEELKKEQSRVHDAAMEKTGHNLQEEAEVAFWDQAVELEERLREMRLNFTLVEDSQGFATLQRGQGRILELIALPEVEREDPSFEHHVVLYLFENSGREQNQKWIKREEVTVQAHSVEQLAQEIATARIGY